MTPEPAYRVKADGTICMAWDVFRAANADDIVKVLASSRSVTPAHKDLREQRTLVVGTFVGNARDTSNTALANVS